jgi:amino acid transporter
MACFAEVSSYFSETGGPYLYARAAFGRLIGIEVGWMFWLVRITAPAANANLFVSYVAEFWPGATHLFPRLAILTILIALLAAINYRDVRAGTTTSNLFTVAKLLPLGIIIVAGLIYIAYGHPLTTAAVLEPSRSSWGKAILLLIFSYGGFEAGVTPMAEAKSPRRDTAFALFIALITCAAVYTLIQWLVVAILPNAAGTDHPLSDLAALVIGRGGAVLVAVGAMTSMYGYLSANMLAVPRITFALAEKRDFPKLFAAIHPRFHTPYVSILMFALLTWIFAAIGSFTWNVTLSAVARLFFYGTTCAALLVFRKRPPGPAAFVLPGGQVIAVLGVLTCAGLLTQVDLNQSIILVATLAVAFLNWVFVRNKAQRRKKQTSSSAQRGS